MTLHMLGDLLPHINAGLNLASALFLLRGLWFIRRRDTHRHRTAMLGALTSSAFFLFFYLFRFALTGTHRFAGEGLARTFYLGILFSHMILAVLIIPLIGRLLYLVWRWRYHAHARWARWTYPLWMYVSVTGLLVYLLLYHMFGYV